MVLKQFVLETSNPVWHLLRIWRQVISVRGQNILCWKLGRDCYFGSNGQICIFSFIFWYTISFVVIVIIVLFCFFKKTYFFFIFYFSLFLIFFFFYFFFFFFFLFFFFCNFIFCFLLLFLFLISSDGSPKICFRLNIFSNKISNLPQPVNFDIPCIITQILTRWLYIFA